MVCNPSFYRDKLTLHSIFEVEIQRLINHKRWPLHVHAVNDQQRTRTLRPFYTTRLRGQYLLSSIINRSSAEKQKRPTSLPSPVMVSFLREERQTENKQAQTDTGTCIRGWGCRSILVERGTGTPLTQVRFPGAGRIFFSPRVKFQCRLSYAIRTPPCAIACINIRADVNDLVVHVRGRWIMETLKHPACTVD